MKNIINIIKSKVLRIGLVAVLLAMGIAGAVVIPTSAVLADTTTFYSTAYDFNSGVGETTYAAAQADTNAVGFDYASAAPFAWVGQTAFAGDTFHIYRSGLYFDTSSIPAGSTILSATLSLYGYALYNTDAAYNIIVVDGSGCASPPTSAVYGTLGSASTSGGTLASSALVTTGYNTINLNSTGLTHIVAGGVTILGLRSSNDISSTAPGAGTAGVFAFYTMEKGTGYKPTLVVSYATPGSLTVSPNAYPAETTSSDGYMLTYNPSQAVWGTMRAAAGTGAGHTDTSTYNGFWSGGTSNQFTQIQRSGYLFDTSSIGSGKTVSSATVYFWIISKSDTNNATPSWNIYSFTPASNTSFASTDYGQTGTTAYSSTAVAYASMPSGGWISFALNATGIAAINRTGITKISQKTTADATNSSPTWASGGVSYILEAMAEDISGHAPYMVVNYSSASAPTVSTVGDSDLATTSFTMLGNVTNIGGSSVDQIGFDWGTASGSYQYGSSTTGTYQTGSFSMSTTVATTLTAGTKYYFRAKAHNTAGWSYGSELTIYTIATSTGPSWQAYGSPGGTVTVASGGAGDWDYYYYHSPCVYWDAHLGKYIQFYDGLNPNLYNGMINEGRATSTDMVNWTQDAGNPVYRSYLSNPNGVSGGDPTLLFGSGGTIYMYMDNDSGTAGSTRFVMSTSTDDGETWGTSVVIGTPMALGSSSIEDPDVVTDPITGNIWLYYTDLNSYSAGQMTLRRVTAQPGDYAGTIAGDFDFTHPTVLTVSNYTDNTPLSENVWYDTNNSTWYMVWMAWGTRWANTDFNRIYYATSTDGINWTCQDSTPIIQGVDPTPVKASNGTYFMLVGTPGTFDDWPVNLNASQWLYTYSTTLPTPNSPANPPSVSTNGVANLTTTSVTLQGTVANMNSNVAVQGAFKWGTTTAMTSGFTTNQTLTAVGGFSANLTGLTPGLTYYYSAILTYNGSATVGGTMMSFTTLTGQPPTTTTTPGGTGGTGSGSLPPPDVTTITSVSIFSNYITAGDQLICIAYKLMYTSGTPTSSTGNYFVVELLNGTSIVAEDPVLTWGMGPASIYLSPAAAAAVTPGSPYVVELVGRQGMFTVSTPPSYSYSLSQGNWMGSINPDHTFIDSWVASTAQQMGTANTTVVTGALSYTVQVSGGRPTTKLNSQGQQIFIGAINQLDIICPELFSSSSIDISGAGPTTTGIPGYANSFQGSLGTSTSNNLATLGAESGLSGSTVGFLFIVCGILLLLSASSNFLVPGAGFVLALVFTVIGVILGITPMEAVIGLGIMTSGTAIWFFIFKGV